MKKQMNGRHKKIQKSIFEEPNLVKRLDPLKVVLAWREIGNDNASSTQHAVASTRGVLATLLIIAGALAWNDVSLNGAVPIVHRASTGVCLHQVVLKDVGGSSLVSSRVVPFVLRKNASN